MEQEQRRTRENVVVNAAALELQRLRADGSAELRRVVLLPVNEARGSRWRQLVHDIPPLAGDYRAATPLAPRQTGLVSRPCLSTHDKNLSGSPECLALVRRMIPQGHGVKGHPRPIPPCLAAVSLEERDARLFCASLGFHALPPLLVPCYSFFSPPQKLRSLAPQSILLLEAYLCSCVNRKARPAIHVVCRAAVIWHDESPRV